MDDIDYFITKMKNGLELGPWSTDFKLSTNSKG